MKNIVAIIIALFFISQLYAQQKGCSDSIVFNKFSPGIFHYFQADFENAQAQRDSADNIFTGGAYGPYSNSRSLTSIIKFNKDNNIIWSKWYKPATNNSNVNNLGHLVANDDSVNLFFINGELPSIPANFNKDVVIKLDSSANFKWAKEITGLNISNFGFTRFAELPITNNGNLFFYNTLGEIAAMSGSGNLLWAKKYSTVNLPDSFFHSGLKICALPNNKLLVCFTGFTSPNGLANHTNAVHYVHFVKINGSTGAVLQQQTIRCFADAGLTTVLKFAPNNLNYDAANGRILLVGILYTGNKGDGTISKQVYCKFDSNLNPINTAYISSNAIFNNAYGWNEAYINVSKKNEVSFIFHEYKGSFNATIDKLNYITVNNNLQITAQRKIDYSLFGFPAAPVKTTIGFKKDGTLSFQSGSNYPVNLPQTLLVYDHIPFYNSLSPCLGYDTTFFTSVPAFAQPVATLNYQDTANIPTTVTDIIPDGFPLQNYPLPKTEICKQVSICDTIKLIGTNTHCLSNATDSFKLVRNPVCKRVTIWQVDTSAIKIISKTDTSLYVQYLKAYNGFVKAGFAGCILTDSLPVSIYNIPANGLNLGNNVQACPGTPVTLRAGTGFKTYLWQDGTVTESFTATQPGKYYVTATDSCSRVYSDTVLVYEPTPVPPNLGNDTMHCPGKTITLHAGNIYKSYQWQDGSANESFTTTQPGQYFVTVTDSCNRLLSDTIIVKPQDVDLALNYPQEICTWDTAKINLPLLITNYTWQPFNTAQLNFNNQWLLYPGVTTTYSITGERPKGCILQDTVLIKTKVCPDFVFFPNAFTPNGDGRNDIYKPFIGGRITFYDFSIYNRYGQIVFKTNNPAKGWDGSFNKSTKPLSGSFVWVCKYQFASQPLVQKKGMCILIR